MPLTARRPSQELIDLVGALGGTWYGRTAMCLCPAHADRTPSLSIRQGDRGILVTCFAGCDREDVLRELRRVPLRQRYSYRDTPARASGNAARLWEEGLPIPGTLAERYLPFRRHAPPVQRPPSHPPSPYPPPPWPTSHPTFPA